MRSHEGDAARSLALRWGLDFRETHTLSIDPNVLGIIDPGDARRHKALPLQMGADGPIFVVAEPSEERFAAVRALAGENVSFVIVAEETLEALMNSKVFTQGVRRSKPVSRQAPVEARRAGGTIPQAPAPQAAAPQAAAPQAAAPQAPAPQAAAPQAPAPQAAAPQAPATEAPRSSESPGSPPPKPEQEVEPPQRPVEAKPAPTPPPVALTSSAQGNEPTELLDNLLSQLAASTGNLSAQVKQLNEALEANQRELREAKEQLAEAHGSNDRYREMVETLRDELASSRALTDATTTRLRDVVRALEAPTLGDALSSRSADEQAAPLDAKRRIA